MSFDWSPISFHTNLHDLGKNFCYDLCCNIYIFYNSKTEKAENPLQKGEPKITFFWVQGGLEKDASLKCTIVLYVIGLGYGKISFAARA